MSPCWREREVWSLIRRVGVFVCLSVALHACVCMVYIYSQQSRYGESVRALCSAKRTHHDWAFCLNWHHHIDFSFPTSLPRSYFFHQTIHPSLLSLSLMIKPFKRLWPLWIMLQRWNIFTLFLDVAKAPLSKVAWLSEVNFWRQSVCVCVCLLPYLHGTWTYILLHESTPVIRVWHFEGRLVLLISHLFKLIQNFNHLSEYQSFKMR